MTGRFVQRHLDLLTSTVGVIAGLGLALATIAVSGAPVVASMRAILDGAFGGSAELSATVAEMVPLIVIGLAWILASSGGLFNVGLDGQIVAGGIAAGAVAIELGLPPGLHLLLPIVAGIVGGIAWAGVAGGLWAWRGVNIIVSTLMLNFIALEMLSWIVRGPLKQPGQASLTPRQSHPQPNGRSSWRAATCTTTSCLLYSSSSSSRPCCRRRPSACACAPQPRTR